MALITVKRPLIVASGGGSLDVTAERGDWHRQARAPVDGPQAALRMDHASDPASLI
jgi:hypothetical protein